MWDQKDALPTTKEMPKPRSLQRPDPEVLSVDQSGAGMPAAQEDRDRRTNGRRFDDSDDDYGPGGGKNDFETDELGNAGGEALGAVKLPDWMQV